MRAHAAQLARVQRPQDHRERDVQRRQLVERLVEAQQHVEQRAEHAVRGGPLEREAVAETR